ncbi:hypothetical protein [Hymenobacter lapidiphilus]|uniref:Uncharacterized protein n=1 Tax=Hymenobacter lapidiphilus TaxID=2608003 RepID=A0A7Y7PSM6_9BACT|nr:hypothetical protein [Hymenobacter lapidiphilus]NVO33294.1 hypothetical protein [Hymenobacter lapidiphilus]
MGDSEALGICISLHDAVVDSFKFDPARARLEIVTWRKIENDSLRCYQLIISGIRDVKGVEKAQAAIDRVLVKAKRSSLGFRIDEFNCKKQPTSQHGKAFVVNLTIDHLAPIVVECAKCTLQNVGSELLAFQP